MRHETDNMTVSQSVEEAYTIYEIAQTKAWNYCDEYNTNTGKVDQKIGYRFLKEGYIDGFLAGFVYKITGKTE
jgi:hypothetical protein